MNIEEHAEGTGHHLFHSDSSPVSQHHRSSDNCKNLAAQIWLHLKGIVVGDEIQYINERGEEVRGIPPRVKPESPWKTLKRPTFMNYVYFLVGWMAWTMDGYDFFTVSLSISRLSEEFNEPRESVSRSLTLTLLFRSVGAILFGLAGDLYGRKWPLIVNLLVVSALQLGTAYCSSFKAFLGVRSLFGIGMGGIWGLSSSMALENLPMEARGLFSGILQQGYSLGCLVAAVFNLTVVPNSPHSWRVLFYIGAGLTTAVAIARLFFPESKQFIEHKTRRKELGNYSAAKRIKSFWTDLKGISRQYWKRMIYVTILMTFFNAMSHTTQDLYPTFMQQTKGFTPNESTVATIVGNVGAIVGGVFYGYYSQTAGRRFSIILACILGAAFIPLWILPTSWSALCAGAFFTQFMVQGAWGVVPIHLQELSPPAFRSSFPGIAYQVGNMIASPCPTIASGISENWKTITNNVSRPNYASTQALMMAVVYVILIFVTAIGKEQLGTHFDKTRAAGDKVTEEERIQKRNINVEAGE